MISFTRKVHKFGIRRLFLLGMIKIICKTKVTYWKWILSDNSPSLNGSKILQPTQFIGKGQINITSANIGVWPSPGLLKNISYIEARNRGSSVNVGCNTFINNNAVIIADKTDISIGERCMIGPNFFACDSDFHGLEIKNRSNGNYVCLPVHIGNDVFIGEGVKVMKGVKIGDGAVIGSGAVVVGNVEPNVICAGVPAKFIKSVPVSYS